MNLVDVLRVECVNHSITVDSKDALLTAIAALAKQSPCLADIEQQTIYDGLTAREELGTTGFGGGIAIPHCRLPEVKDFVVGIITIKNGVDFKAVDDQPVKLAVFIVAPECSSNQHIKILSSISQVLNIPGAIDEMVAATSGEILSESFLRNARDEADPKEHNNKNLFRLVIRNEELFHDILKVLSSVTTSSVVVAEAEPAANYLTKMPLFSGFWSDTRTEFCKVIHAAVDKRYTNEAIRRIEHEAGALDERDDILLMVHELFYCSGELNI